MLGRRRRPLHDRGARHRAARAPRTSSRSTTSARSGTGSRTTRCASSSSGASQDVLGEQRRCAREWPLVRLIGAFVQVSRALAYAHRRGVLHRDIKPENILLGDFGEVYLADWGNAKRGGLARVEGARGRAPLARQRARTATRRAGLGHAGYIAPEQIRGDRAAIDHRADLFALGVVLYEILTGRAPVRRAHRARRDPRDRRRACPSRRAPIAPSCPLLLEDLCLALLAKEPANRPESADRVAPRPRPSSRAPRSASAGARRRAGSASCAQVPVRAEPRARRRARAARSRGARAAPRTSRDASRSSASARAGSSRTAPRAVEREQAVARWPRPSSSTRRRSATTRSHRGARAGLADLYWSRAREAEARAARRAAGLLRGARLRVRRGRVRRAPQGRRARSRSTRARRARSCSRTATSSAIACSSRSSSATSGRTPLQRGAARAGQLPARAQARGLPRRALPGAARARRSTTTAR